MSQLAAETMLPAPSTAVQRRARLPWWRRHPRLLGLAGGVVACVVIALVAHALVTGQPRPDTQWTLDLADEMSGGQSLRAVDGSAGDLLLTTEQGWLAVSPTTDGESLAMIEPSSGLVRWVREEESVRCTTVDDLLMRCLVLTGGRWSWQSVNASDGSVLTSALVALDGLEPRMVTALGDGGPVVGSDGRLLAIGPDGGSAGQRPSIPRSPTPRRAR